MDGWFINNSVQTNVDLPKFLCYILKIIFTVCFYWTSKLRGFSLIKFDMFYVDFYFPRFGVAP